LTAPPREVGEERLKLNLQVESTETAGNSGRLTKQLLVIYCPLGADGRAMFITTNTGDDDHEHFSHNATSSQSLVSDSPMTLSMFLGLAASPNIPKASADNEVRD